VHAFACAHAWLGGGVLGAWVGGWRGGGRVRGGQQGGHLLSTSVPLLPQSPVLMCKGDSLWTILLALHRVGALLRIMLSRGERRAFWGCGGGGMAVTIVQCRGVGRIIKDAHLNPTECNMNALALCACSPSWPLAQSSAMPTMALSSGLTATLSELVVAMIGIR
jgi:hypothetical protein